MGTQGAGMRIASRAVSRRQFIGAAGAVGASYVLIGPNGMVEEREQGPLAALARTTARALSVGYVTGSQAAGSVLKAGARVVPARRMRSGDSSLHGPARIAVLGTTAGLAAAVAGGVQSVYLDALIPAPRPLDRDTLLPFYAWTMTAAPDVRTSPAATFGAEFDRRPRLGFSLDVRGAAGGAAAAAGVASVSFTTGSQAGLAKLKPGLYLLGIEDGVWEHERVLPDPADEAGWQGLVSLLVSIHPAD
ncbi:MAG TPA: twin-arginine translocation signal domain-containing protein [Acidimicrobiales bacterium]|nr:twin-arginine translocation signal domain-containing protein [Acidimicrobiales bacterium]